MVAGNPAIAYQNFTDTNLMFARNSASDGSGTWAITTVDRAGRVGKYASMAIVNGNPAIAYFDVSTATVKFARSAAADGSGTWTTAIIDMIGGESISDDGAKISLTIVNGKPALSYYNNNPANLKFARNAMADGSGVWTVTTVDSTSFVGEFSSLALMTDGTPAISYYDAANGHLKFAHNSAVDGSGTWTLSTIDIGGGFGLVGYYTSLALVNGKPAIAYTDINAHLLRFAINSAAGGTGTWTITTVDSANYGFDISLKVINGKPAVSYRTATAANDLLFARNSAVDGSGTWTLTTVDAPSGAGAYSSLAALASGNPAISYYDTANSNLKFARNSAVDGSGTWTLVIVDTGFESGNVGSSSSQAIINGNPAIIYYDTSGLVLKFARNSAADGSGTWNIGTIANINTSGPYAGLATVSGTPAVCYWTSNQLIFSRNTAPDGSGTWNSQVVTTQTVLKGAALAVMADGTPAICYTRNGAGGIHELVFFRNSAVDGSGIWTSSTVSPGQFVGGTVSMAVINGNPAISYTEFSPAFLRFARNSAADGSGTWTIVNADTSSNVGNNSSLAVVGGLPAISYYDLTNQNLKFALNAAADGSGIWTKTTVASTGSVGQFSSTTSVDGYPVISYYDQTNASLGFARANDIAGAGTWTLTTLDSPHFVNDQVGSNTSMVMLGNGKIAISYYAGTKGDLKWATVGFSSSLSITSVSHPVSNHTVVEGKFAPNAVVTIKASPDLLSAPTAIGTATADVNGVFQYDDAGAVGLQMRFYRATYP